MTLTSALEKGAAKQSRSNPIGVLCWRGAIIAAIAAFSLAAWIQRDAELMEMAALWIITDPVARADAAVVLGGGVEDRPFAAANYYRLGLVKRILVSNAHQGPAERLGVVASSAAADEIVLLKLGVPADAIELFGEDLNNTDDEAEALRDWARNNNAQSLLVPTEIFSARRVRWIMRRVLGDGIGVRVVALDPPDYQRDDWWCHEQGVLAFQNELIKYLYYRLKY